jgi:hypothetical protein
MRYWLDTEFLEDGRTIELISIGIVAEDGREFYAENADFDWDQASDWLKEHVRPHLQPDEYAVPRYAIAPAVLSFVREGGGQPEFWGYYADYDWVVFCWLFGRMVDLPDGFPMYCRDIKQWADQLGDVQLPEQEEAEHNALADARWNRMAWGVVRGEAS